MMYCCYSTSFAIPGNTMQFTKEWGNFGDWVGMHGKMMGIEWDGMGKHCGVSGEAWENDGD